MPPKSPRGVKVAGAALSCGLDVSKIIAISARGHFMIDTAFDKRTDTERMLPTATIVRQDSFPERINVFAIEFSSRFESCM
jgi:hypothetical protein